MSILETLEEIMLNCGLESDGIERPYKNEFCESELSDIDSIVSIFDIGTEGEVFINFDMASIEAVYENENGKFDFSEFTGFGTESIGDKLKTSQEKLKTFIKKIAASVVTFFKRVINMITNNDLMLAKYGKIITKLDKDLSKKVFVDRTKNITINPVTNLDTVVYAAYHMNSETISLMIDRIKKEQKNWDSFYRYLMDDILRMSGIRKEIYIRNGSPTPEALASAVKNKDIIKKYEEKIKNCDPEKSEEMTIFEAKRTLQSRVKSIDKYTKVNVKVQGRLRDYIACVEKSVDTFIKNGELKYWEEQNCQVRIREMKSVEVMGPAMVQIQTGKTMLFKHVTKCLNKLILNMRKLINE